MTCNPETVCLVRAIPSLCAGAAGEALSTALPALCESGAVIYNTDADYAVGKLKTHLPGYNPAYGTISAYGFNSNTVTSSWGAEVYAAGSGGAIESATSTTSGACASNSYDVTDSNYTLIAWAGLLTEISGGWFGGGGYCSGGSWGYLAPGGGITSPPGNINTVLNNVNTPVAPQGGGSSGGSGGVCNLFIGVVTSAPAGGFGRGTVQSAKFYTDGSYETISGSVAVVFPFIG